ncbi:MAG: 4-(cytidine 5'-diphospho)-2-C-methyl-D-erythritol kinase [Terriglobales bacterium]
MAIAVRSFAKINIGLCIGARRPDGFHELRTVYQTISLHDTVRVDVQRGTGVEIRVKDPRVPVDESNTCWRVAERVMKVLAVRGKVVIAIDKQLPVQGGLGAASSNAVATMMGLERVLKTELPPEERLRIAAEVGSDLPLFLVGGRVLGTGRGEEVYPLEELGEMHAVVATPAVGVSTPQAFKDWDEQFGCGKTVVEGSERRAACKLTDPGGSGRINKFSHSVLTWLAGSWRQKSAASGVPADRGGDRAETPLLDLVRAGIENDFERVVFPKYPELREVKRLLEREGARYASLSGSGSALYGLFQTGEQAERAAVRLSESGVPAQSTATLTRAEYWRQIFAD